MRRIERTVSINASPDAVFSFLTDFEHYPAWIGELDEVKVHSRSKAQAHVEFRSLIQVRHANWSAEYTWDTSSRQLCWQVLKSNVIESAAGQWILALDSGNTLLTYRAQVRIDLPVSLGIINRIENIFVGPATNRGIGLIKSRIENNITEARRAYAVH